MKTTLQVLIDARVLIEKPENWGQGFRLFERQKTLCAYQAIHRATGGYWGARHAATAFKNSNGCLGFSGITTFNDTHDHGEVLAAFDKAIKAERAKVSA